MSSNERLFSQRLLNAEIARGRSANAVRVMPVFSEPPGTELLSEIKVSPRFAGKTPPVVPHLAGGLNSVEYARVSGAAAQMTRERLRHRGAIARASPEQ